MKNSIIKSAVIASVIALAVSGFAGCTKKPGQANNNAVVGITQEPGIFDPHTVVAAGDEEIIFNVYEGLYKYDSKGDLNPCLATDVAISDDASVLNRQKGSSKMSGGIFGEAFWGVMRLRFRRFNRKA